MVISINLHYSDKKPCLNGKFKEGKVKKSGGGGRMSGKGRWGEVITLSFVGSALGPQ